MKTWVRWAILHGGPGAFLRVRARRGDPVSEILAGRRAGPNPYPFGDRVREQGRLVRTPFSWVSADHEVCRNILRDKNFGVTPPETMNLPGPVLRLLRATDPKLANPVEPPSMLMVDPPEHTRYRKLVAQEFTPRAIARLRDRIAEVTDELLTDLATRPAADLIQDFARLLPVAIICEILGVPKEKEAELLELGHAGAPLLDVGISWRAFRRAMTALRDSQDYLEGHIEELRADPGDNILSELTVGGLLTKPELMATATLVTGAGFETTVNLLGNGIVALHENPDQLDLLRAEPHRWPGAVEEILRYDSPVQMTARIALCDREIAGHPIARGEMVSLLLGAANRDPAVFDDPTRFDVTRPNAKDHLSFSSGVHACLGASLARTEGVIALSALYERFPGLRLTGPPERRGLVNLRGYQRIPAAPGLPAASSTV
ncbi:cytochrome P450 [Nocardia suismassiliense]|uniref:Cytochrome P450 n=1 Tax=Nocardia suismassiliense TaxID=2077092 RepID=A0ABW6QNX9_9NOCA